MATRATYTLKNNSGHLMNFSMDVYIHWDGYEAGALLYYLNAVNKNEEGSIKSGGFIESFIAGNCNHLEISKKSLHGDTEFHYDMSWNEIKIYTKKWDENAFKLKEILTPLSFLERYGDKEEKEKYCFFDGRLRDKNKLIEGVKSKMDQIYRMAAMGHSGNASSMCSEAWKKIGVYLKSLDYDDTVIDEVIAVIPSQIDYL